MKGIAVVLVKPEKKFCIMSSTQPGGAANKIMKLTFKILALYMRVSFLGTR